ncbi:hypothetical protein HA466_0320800 [Hirschfeldia incana]|nr:hypothetical protein HA466_0320800 [Hirschfeldia incana]
MDLGEVMTDGEKSKEGKKRSKAPLAKLLSQYSQNPYRIMRDHVFTVGCNDVIYLSKTNLFPAPCVKSSSLMSIGCNSGDIGLEEDDEIHEKILTSITTNHQDSLTDISKLEEKKASIYFINKHFFLRRHRRHVSAAAVIIEREVSLGVLFWYDQTV